ncbi:UxaA family hydrolase, partial [Pseudomonas sp. SIMBA_059]
GSITNFPFVPTIKIVTTTERFELLESDMDFNAGSLMDGKPFQEAVEELYEHTLTVASGTRSKGELTGQSQVQIWRDWHESDNSAGRRPLQAVRTGPAFANRGAVANKLPNKV